MRSVVVSLSIALLAACSGEPTVAETSAIARQNAVARDAAQGGRILNPEALKCVRASASEEEWAIISAEGAEAATVLQSGLARESTARCFSINNVVVYL